MYCWSSAGLLLVLNSGFASSSRGWAAAGLVLIALIVGAPDLLLCQGGVDALLLGPPLRLFARKERY